MAAAPQAQTTGTLTPADENAGPGAFPPFDPANIAPQLVWLAILFGALYLLMSRIALPRVAGILEQRAGRISSDIDQAHAMQQQADEAGAAYDSTLADAKGRAQALAAQTHARLSGESEAKRSALETELNAKLATAEATIEATKAQAMSNVGAIATDAASAIVGRLMGRPADTAAIAKAVAAFV